MKTQFEFLPLYLLGASLGALADAPLRLPNGEPLACIYYFAHWWEPWKSDDEAVRRDFKRLRLMGFNTLLLDHEWSQAIDGNWRWLDREHRLAQEAGFSILPWLSAKSWSDIDTENRAKLFEEWYGEKVVFGIKQDGSKAAPLIYDQAILRGGAKYTLDYLDRYCDKALLRLVWNGEVRPVVSLSVETGWRGSFDETTNLLFSRWLRDRYESIQALNTAWKTQFKGFFQINPLDRSVFDYEGHGAAIPRAVEDHVAFRSELISDSLARMGALIRQKYPQILLLAEIPYQYGSQHPDATLYRTVYGANPESCNYADVVLFRCTGPLDTAEAQMMRIRQQSTGQRFVFTYRSYSDWDVATNAPVFGASVALYAGQAAEFASGFGFYSWNEMLDTHVAYSSVADIDPTWTQERSEKAIALMAAMMQRYRDQAQIQQVLPRWGLSTIVGGRDFQTRLYGERGVTYVVESSINLLDWTPRFTNRFEGSDFIDFSESDFTSARYKFFRARQRLTLNP